MVLTKVYAYQENNKDGLAVNTHVKFRDDDETCFVALLPADAINKTDAELIKLTLESHYNRYFPNRAENEKFEKMDEALKDYETRFNDMENRFKTILNVASQFSLSKLEDEGEEDEDEETISPN